MMLLCCTSHGFECEIEIANELTIMCGRSDGRVTSFRRFLLQRGDTDLSRSQHPVPDHPPFLGDLHHFPFPPLLPFPSLPSHFRRYVKRRLMQIRIKRRPSTHIHLLHSIIVKRLVHRPLRQLYPAEQSSQGRISWIDRLRDRFEGCREDVGGG